MAKWRIEWKTNDSVVGSAWFDSFDELLTFIRVNTFTHFEVKLQ